MRVTYGGNPILDEVQAPSERRGVRLGRKMLRLALSSLATEGDTTAEPADQFVDLTIKPADATIHWRVPLGSLTEFLDRADSEMPDLKAE